MSAFSLSHEHGLSFGMSIYDALNTDDDDDDDDDDG